MQNSSYQIFCKNTNSIWSWKVFLRLDQLSFVEGFAGGYWRRVGSEEIVVWVKAPGLNPVGGHDGVCWNVEMRCWILIDESFVQMLFLLT